MNVEIIRGFADVSDLNQPFDYPYKELEPGDAFCIPYDGVVEKTVQRNRINARNQYAAKALGRRFGIRSGAEGFYILRIA